MKNIKLKIIISVIVLVMILLISTNIQATLYINGRTYYTKNDISWTGSNISWNGLHWCINHGFKLQQGLTKTKTTTSTTETYAVMVSWFAENTSTFTNWIRDKKTKYLAKMNESLVGANTVAYIVEGYPKYGVASSAKEAAIYGFKYEFKWDDSDTKNAIWNLECDKGNESLRRRV